MDSHRSLLTGRLPPVLPPASQAIQTAVNQQSAASASHAAKTSLSHLTHAYSEPRNEYQVHRHHYDSHHHYPPQPPPQQQHLSHQQMDDDRSIEDQSYDGSEPTRKKQRRNKPTLSCFECVERKTKVRKNKETKHVIPLTPSIAMSRDRLREKALQTFAMEPKCGAIIHCVSLGSAPAWRCNFLDPPNSGPIYRTL